MSLILTILKNVWPVLRINNRTPVDRATYVAAEDGTLILAENGEVITTE